MADFGGRIGVSALDEVIPDFADDPCVELFRGSIDTDALPPKPL